MVLDYYKLRKQPFGVTPDCRYLYASATHREALASLLYGIDQGRGFAALIAQPGMGKTTLLFRALELLREKATTAFLFQTMSTPVDLMQALLTDLGVRETGASLAELQGKLNSLLAEYSRSGKRLVVVIDEAQKLDEPVLELLRMLSNFETGEEKLVQIVLAGQPQLAEKLASPDLVQLRQRISIIARLNPFSAEETALYIGHRIQIAGLAPGTQLFDASALALIAQASQGIPRNINNLCFNALSLGCALKQKTIGTEIIREVLGDLDLETIRRPVQRAAPVLLTEPAEQVISRPAPAKPPGAWRLQVSAKYGQEASDFFRKTAAVTRRHRGAAAAAALAIMLIGSALLLHHKPAPTEAAINRGPAVLPARSADPNPPAPQPTPENAIAQPQRQSSGPTTVRVKPGETLSAICRVNFGSCNDRLLQKILDLNPQLDDMDDIESGQTIRIPAGTLTGNEQGNLNQPVGPAA